MTWYAPPKEAAADPDNPTADEQFPFSEFNNMVTYLKDRISNHVVNAAAIGNNKILVYKAAGDGTFVYEDQNEITALNDIPDVVISGVPADNEVVAYDTATSKFINQTAAEAGLALVANVVLEADFAATTFLYATADNTPQPKTVAETLAILSVESGADVTDATNVAAAGAVMESDFDATTFLYATADNAPLPKTRAETMALLSGTAGAEFLFNTQKIGGIVDPTTAQQAATKNYADTKLIGRDVLAGGPWTDGYGLIYRTANGRFEMENLVDPPFEVVTNVIREKSANSYDNDFVVGSPQLADDGDVSHFSRMFFDKSKSAFRAGIVGGTQWDNPGDYSFAIGYNNSAALYSFAGGNTNAANGTCSVVYGLGCVTSANYSSAMGRYANAYLYGQSARANTHFTTDGDAQASSLTAQKTTTDGTANVELFLLGTYRAILPANRTWAFSVLIAARQTAGAAGTVGDSAAYKIEGGIKRDGANNTALVGAITKTVIAEDQAAWDVTAVADDTNEALAVKVTGEANKTIHWVAKIDLVEVG